MEASYPGTCPCGCGIKIHQGMTQIEYVSEYGWVIKGHPITPKICPSCRMTLPATGKCDDCD